MNPMIFSKETLAGTLPTWGLFEEIEPFIQQHPNWTTYVIDIRFTTAKGFTPLAPRTQQRVMRKIHETGGVATLAQFVAEQVFENLSKEELKTEIVALGYHMRPQATQPIASGVYAVQDVKNSRVFILYATRQGLAQAGRNALEKETVLYTPIPTIRIDGVFWTHGVSPVLEYGNLEKTSKINGKRVHKTLHSPKTLDASPEHAWIHSAIAATMNSSNMYSSPLMTCGTIDPVTIAETFDCHFIPEPVKTYVREILATPTECLTKSQNEYRLLAAALLETPVDGTFEKTLKMLHELS